MKIHKVTLSILLSSCFAQILIAGGPLPQEEALTRKAILEAVLQDIPDDLKQSVTYLLDPTASVTRILGLPEGASIDAVLEAQERLVQRLRAPNIPEGQNLINRLSNRITQHVNKHFASVAEPVQEPSFAQAIAKLFEEQQKIKPQTSEDRLSYLAMIEDYYTNLNERYGNDPAQVHRVLDFTQPPTTPEQVFKRSDSISRALNTIGSGLSVSQTLEAVMPIIRIIMEAGGKINDALQVQ